MSTQIDLGKVVGPPGPPGGMNLLDNWYFRDPVNQREISGTITTPGYFIDRWYLVDGNVELTNNGIVLNGTIEQILEIKSPGGKFYPTVFTTDGEKDLASYDISTNTFSITASGETLVAAWLTIIGVKEKPLDESKVTWENFINAAWEYAQNWEDAEINQIFETYGIDLINDDFLLRKSLSGETFGSVSELYDDSWGDTLYNVIALFFSVDRYGDFTSDGFTFDIAIPTWHEFQYAIIHYDDIAAAGNVLPSLEEIKAEAEEKYTWRYTVDEKPEIILYPPNKSLELAKCQNYFLRTDFVFCEYITSGAFNLFIPTPATVKNDPLVKGTGEWFVSGGNQSFSFADSEIGIANSNGVYSYMSISDPNSFSVEGNGLKPLAKEGNSYIEINCEPQKQTTFKMARKLSKSIEKTARNNIARWYNEGFLDESKVQKAVAHNVITQDEANEILGGDNN